MYMCIHLFLFVTVFLTVDFRTLLDALVFATWCMGRMGTFVILFDFCCLIFVRLGTSERAQLYSKDDIDVPGSSGPGLGSCSFTHTSPRPPM